MYIIRLKLSIHVLDAVQVTEADYDALLAMSVGLYEGHDHLPPRFKKWCRDPTRHLFGTLRR